MSVKVIESGDLFASECHVITCPVNTVGVMGAGLAKAVSIRYPGIGSNYRHAIHTGKLAEGRPWLYPIGDGSGKSVLFFATKRDWRDGSSLDWVVEGLNYLKDHFQEMGIESIAMPALGCGLGKVTLKDGQYVAEDTGFDVDDVLQVVHELFDDSPLVVEFYKDGP